MNLENYTISSNAAVQPSEIMTLRHAVGWKPATVETWEACLAQSLCVVTARLVATSELIGVGFLAGNARHAQLVDMSVHPDHQRQGIGRRLQQERLDFASNNGIEYVTLTWDRSKPWLKDFYESMGFGEIDDAMRLRA